MNDELGNEKVILIWKN